MNDLRPVRKYIRTIEKELALGNATEHTHRSALKILLESLGEGIVATNEPRRVEYMVLLISSSPQAQQPLAILKPKM
mgnify:CR=1 FL=1